MPPPSPCACARAACSLRSAQRSPCFHPPGSPAPSPPPGTATALRRAVGMDVCVVINKMPCRGNGVQSCTIHLIYAHAHGRTKPTASATCTASMEAYVAASTLKTTAEEKPEEGREGRSATLSALPPTSFATAHHSHETHSHANRHTLSSTQRTLADLVPPGGDQVEDGRARVEHGPQVLVPRRLQRLRCVLDRQEPLLLSDSSIG